jgi:hypothetical protein
MSYVTLVIPTLSVTVQTLIGGVAGRTVDAGIPRVGIRPIREGSGIETLWSYSIHITPDPAATDMKIWARKRKRQI